MTEIKLKKRYPHSREEDITDAFMRGYVKGKADRPQGEWISVCGNKQCNCSVCGEGFDHTYEWIERWNYCPNCGARMKGADDERSNNESAVIFR